jgi:sugar phosphate isomerase/epimerase
MVEYEIGGYKIPDIYQGSYSSLDPSNNYIAAGTLGMTTDPRTANILQEVSTKLSSGVKQIEISAVSPEVFDSMPRQQLKEVNRLSKLTGIDVSLHAPVIDVSGIDPRSGFSESEREISEKKVTEALLRAKELNPDGSIPVTFHSAEGIPGSQLLPPSERKEGKKYKRLLVVNRETGRLAPLEEEKKFYPGEGEVRKEVYDPEKNLKVLNHTEWDNTLSQIEFNRVRADEILKDVNPIFRDLYVNWRVSEVNPSAVPASVLNELNNLSAEESEQLRKIHAAATYTDQANKTAIAAFDKAYKNSKTEEEKKLLEIASKKYGEILGIKDGKKTDPRSFDPKTQSDALFTLIRGLEKLSPELNVPIEGFAVEKSAQTFGNAAFNAYKKFKDKAPTLVIENPPAGFALSTGEDIKNIVKESRKHFVENATKPTNKGGLGMGKSQAKEEAEKIIGATWDVGHINMLRKYGYTEEEIVKETEKVAPYVKHVHLSDNFGFEHTELPIGMGNVPLKKMMEKLGEKGVEAKKIVEAASWWQHFKTPPFQEVLEAVGSPVYAMKMAPFWYQAAGLREEYSSGYGQMLPQINYETWGSGFSMASLPIELGGQIPGAKGGRMSGRPME